MKTMHKILIVDDEQNVVEALRRQFHGQYEVFTALSGEEALRVQAEQGPFAVIVSDMRMPKMNGIEYLIKARQVDANATLMMLTGNADRQTAIDAVAQGKVFQFLTKPCSEEEFDMALTSAIALYAIQGKIGQIETYVRRTA